MKIDFKRDQDDAGLPDEATRKRTRREGPDGSAVQAPSHLPESELRQQAEALYREVISLALANIDVSQRDRAPELREIPARDYIHAMGPILKMRSKDENADLVSKIFKLEDLEARSQSIAALLPYSKALLSDDVSALIRDAIGTFIRDENFYLLARWEAAAAIACARTLGLMTREHEEMIAAEEEGWSRRDWCMLQDFLSGRTREALMQAELVGTRSASARLNAFRDAAEDIEGRYRVLTGLVDDHSDKPALFEGSPQDLAEAPLNAVIPQQEEPSNAAARTEVLEQKWGHPFGPSESAARLATGVPAPRDYLQTLPVELLDKILQPLISNNMRETRRDLSAVRQVTQRLNHVVATWPQLQKVKDLRREARILYKEVMSKGLPEEDDYQGNKPPEKRKVSASDHIRAAGPILKFQSETENADLVSKILKLKNPTARAQSIAALLPYSEALATEHQSAIILDAIDTFAKPRHSLDIRVRSEAAATIGRARALKFMTHDHEKRITALGGAWHPTDWLMLQDLLSGRTLAAFEREAPAASIQEALHHAEWAEPRNGQAKMDALRDAAELIESTYLALVDLSGAPSARLVLSEDSLSELADALYDAVIPRGPLPEEEVESYREPENWLLPTRDYVHTVGPILHFRSKYQNSDLVSKISDLTNSTVRLESTAALLPYFDALKHEDRSSLIDDAIENFADLEHPPHVQRKAAAVLVLAEKLDRLTASHKARIASLAPPESQLHAVLGAEKLPCKPKDPIAAIREALSRAPWAHLRVGQPRMNALRKVAELIEAASGRTRPNGERTRERTDRGR